MPRLSPFINGLDDIIQLTPSTLKRIVEPSKFRPEQKFYQTFLTTVVHTDGSSFTYKSTLPTIKRVTLVKDTVQHPTWNPRISAAQLDQNSAEFIKFRSKFVEQDNGLNENILADLAFSDKEAAPVEMSEKNKESKAGNKKKRRR